MTAFGLELKKCTGISIWGSKPEVFNTLQILMGNKLFADAYIYLYNTSIKKAEITFYFKQTKLHM